MSPETTSVFRRKRLLVIVVTHKKDLVLNKLEMAYILNKCFALSLLPAPFYPPFVLSASSMLISDVSWVVVREERKQAVLKTNGMQLKTENQPAFFMLRLILPAEGSVAPSIGHWLTIPILVMNFRFPVSQNWVGLIFSIRTVVQKSVMFCYKKLDDGSVFKQGSYALYFWYLNTLLPFMMWFTWTK